MEATTSMGRAFRAHVSAFVAGGMTRAERSAMTHHRATIGATSRNTMSLWVTAAAAMLFSACLLPPPIERCPDAGCDEGSGGSGPGPGSGGDGAAGGSDVGPGSGGAGTGPGSGGTGPGPGAGGSGGTAGWGDAGGTGGGG